MKILLSTDFYDTAVNGVVTSVVTLKKSLEKRGHEVRVLTLSESHHSFRKGDIIYIGSVSAAAVYPGARVRTALAQSIIRETIAWKPDVVHSNCEFSTFMIAKHIAQKCHVPFIHTYHTVYEDYYRYIIPFEHLGLSAVKVFSRTTANDSDCVICPTEKVSKLLKGYGVKVPLAIVPTGIDEEKYAGAASSSRKGFIRKQFGIPENCTILLTLGRLGLEKNHKELIDYLGRIDRKDVCLIIVGDGPAREGLEEQTRALGLERRVFFTGMVKPENTPAYYAEGDVFVSASTSETQGLTYVEAAMTGLPLLCRKDPCLEGVVENGVNGWQYETEEDFRNHLEEYLAMTPGQRAELGMKSKEIAHKYSSDVFAEKVEAIYKEYMK